MMAAAAATPSAAPAQAESGGRSRRSSQAPTSAIAGIVQNTIQIQRVDV